MVESIVYVHHCYNAINLTHIHMSTNMWIMLLLPGLLAQHRYLSDANHNVPLSEIIHPWFVHASCLLACVVHQSFDKDLFTIHTGEWISRESQASREMSKVQNLICVHTAHKGIGISLHKMLRDVQYNSHVRAGRPSM